MNIKKIIREVFDNESTFKRNVYGDNEEYREVEKERVIIWNPNYRVGFQFIFDQEELPNYTFIHLYPYSEDNNFVWDYELSGKDKSKVFIDAIKKLPKVLKNYFKKFGRLDTIVFRPKTSQMGNIYSSPSALRILESEFGSDYDIEVVKESLPSIPTNSVIMRLKKNQNIDETIDDFDWVRSTNPSFDPNFILESNKKGEVVAIWFDYGIDSTTRDYIISFSDENGYEPPYALIHYSDEVRALTFYPDRQMGFLKDEESWDRYMEAIHNGEYDDVGPNNLYVIGK